MNFQRNEDQQIIPYIGDYINITNTGVGLVIFYINIKVIKKQTLFTLFNIKKLFSGSLDKTKKQAITVSVLIYLEKYRLGATKRCCLQFSTNS